MLRYFGKTSRNETVLTASVSRKLIALSVISINIEQRALESGSVGYNSHSPKCKIHDRTSTSTSSKISCCEKDNPLPSMVNDFFKWRKNSDDLENIYNG